MNGLDPPSRPVPPVIKAAGAIVACLGSSSTAGKGQAFDWIGELRKRPRNQRFRFHNFGIGGDLAYNALQRLPAVLACRPDKVVVWIGGNDVLALVSGKVRRFFQITNRLPREPWPEWFSENLEAIAGRLKEETRAAVALCSLPPIGEDPTPAEPFQAQLNQRVEEFSAIIKDAAREAGVGYLAVHEAMLAAIQSSPGLGDHLKTGHR